MRLHPARTSIRASRRPAMVLIIVVVVMVMLSLGGLSFVATMHTENKAAHVQGRRLQLEHVAGSGGELLKAFFQQSWTDQQEAGGAWDNTDRFRGVVVLEDETAGRRARFSVVSPKTEDGEATGMRFGVENESAKLNLGVLLRWEEREPAAARRALMSLPGMTDSIADALLDWIDPDSTPRSSGAEADYYQGLKVPYAPRNGVPQCLEELLMVRGVTRELLFGVEADSRRGAGAGRRGAVGGGISRFAPASRVPWASLLTVCSAERNETLDGRPRINLNADDLRLLHQQLSAVVDRAWADFVVLYRQNGPYRGRRAADPALPAVDLSLPAKVKIESVLDLVGAKVRLAGDRRTAPVAASPISAEPAAMRDSLPKLLNIATLVSAPIIEGKINLNLAPRPVLMAVPGIDPALVDRILVARGSRGSREDAQRRFPTWLLTEGLVDMPRMKALLSYLTGGGDVVRAQVIGYYDELGPSMRAELVIDAASYPPRQIYWKDLRLLGRGYPLEALGAEPRERLP